MSKGSSPRNCFSREYKDNYDEIDWSKPTNQPTVSDKISKEQSEVFMGMVRQATDNPLTEEEKGLFFFEEEKAEK